MQGFFIIFLIVTVGPIVLHVFYTMEMTYSYRQLCVFYIIASNVQTDLSPT